MAYLLAFRPFKNKLVTIISIIFEIGIVGNESIMLKYVNPDKEEN